MIACSLFWLKLSSMVKTPPRPLRSWHQGGALQKKPPSTVAGSVPPVRKERHKYNAPRTAARSFEIGHEILGSVAEPFSAHLRRHRNFDKYCTRCTWYKFESKWRHTCCSIRKEDQGSLQLRCWAQERPAHLGGTWALGCVVCSQAAQLVEERPKQDLAVKFNARWATHQFRLLLHPSHLAGHARSEGHRRALRLLQDPGSVAGSPSTVAGSFPPVRKERHQYNAPSTAARSSELSDS